MGMWFASFTVLFLLALPVAAQYGLDARRSADQYPAHKTAGDLTVAAEFHFRAVEYQGDTHFLRDALVVEVALYRQGMQKLDVGSVVFRLNVNGKKTLFAQTAGLVLSQEHLGSQPALDIFVQDGRVRLGGPDLGRYPEKGRPQPLPRVEDPNRPQREAPSLDAVLQQLALPTGKRTLPVAGMVYFQYRKKLKSIKKLELVCDGPSGESVALKLR